MKIIKDLDADVKLLLKRKHRIKIISFMILLVAGTTTIYGLFYSALTLLISIIFWIATSLMYSELNYYNILITNKKNRGR